MNQILHFVVPEWVRLARPCSSYTLPARRSAGSRLRTQALRIAGLASCRARPFHAFLLVVQHNSAHTLLVSDPGKRLRIE